MKAEREKRMIVIDMKGTTKERQGPRGERRGKGTTEVESRKAKKRDPRRTTSNSNILESNKTAM